MLFMICLIDCLRFLFLFRTTMPQLEDVPSNVSEVGSTDEADVCPVNFAPKTLDSK